MVVCVCVPDRTFVLGRFHHKSHPPTQMSSVVSEGDYEMFMSVANPDKVKVRKKSEALRSPPRLEEEDDDDDDERADSEEEEDKRNEGERDSSEASTPPRRRREEVDEDDESSVAGGKGGGGGGAFSSYLQQPAAALAGGGASRAVGRMDAEREVLEKQTVLLDMERLRMQGVQLSRKWTLDDDLDDMKFELKRVMLHVDEMSNIGVMRSSLQVACTGIEMMSKRFKLLDLDGWSAEVCRDMSKHDRSLGKLYRKYWRRTHTNSPEAELAMSIFGSMAMHHFRKTFARNVLPPPPAASAPPAPPRRRRDEEEEDDDDEGLPP